MAKKPAPSTNLPEFEDDAVQQKRVIARSVYVEVATGGRRASQEPVPLHEIPLLAAKVRALKSEIMSIAIPESISPDRKRPNPARAMVRDHDMADIEEIFKRLNERYTFLPEGAREGDEINVVETIYGTGKDGLKALAVTMRKLHDGFEPWMDSMGENTPDKAAFMKFIAANGPRAALEDEIEAEILNAK